MGWSCSALANHRLDAISAWCIAQTGSQNTYVDKEGRYFWEASRREHGDGAITGSIHRMIGETQCIKSGSFRIEPDGSIKKAPKALKSAPALVLKVDGHTTSWKGEVPTDTTLHAYIHGDYIKQFLPGGFNHQVSTSLGRIPYPTSATIINLDTGKVVASWKAAMFEAWQQ